MLGWSSSTTASPNCCRPVPNLWPDTPLGFVINAIGPRSARSILEFEVITQSHPFEPYRLLVEQVILPNFGPFVFAIGATETIVGVLLILGLLTPIAAVVAALGDRGAPDLGLLCGESCGTLVMESVRGELLDVADDQDARTPRRCDHGYRRVR